MSAVGRTSGSRAARPSCSGAEPSETLYVSSVGSPGAVVEIAELLAALGAGTAV